MLLRYDETTEKVNNILRDYLRLKSKKNLNKLKKIKKKNITKI